MEMIQKAKMFQDAAPVVLQQFGRGAAAVLRSSNSGRFDEILQGKQPAPDDGAVKTDPQEDDRNSGSALGPFRWQNAQFVVTDATESRQTTGDTVVEGGAAVAPDTKGPDREVRSSDIQRKSLAAEGPDAASLDAFRAAAWGAVSDDPQKAEAKEEVGQTQTRTDASETVPRDAAVSGAQAQDAVTSGLSGASDQQQAVRMEGAASDRTTDSKGPHAAKGSHGPYAAAARGVTDQTDTKPDTSSDVPGIKAATTTGTAKFVPFQGFAGQDGFGDAEKKGHPGQKAQGVDGTQIQPQGIGLHDPLPVEAAQADTKQTSLKSALHESILSQVKDGVVTHDGKGNGQMSIRLNPGELGELKIQVRMEGSQVRVEVQADNRMVKDLLMCNLDSLKDALTNKNLTMEGFDVSTGGGGFKSPLPEEKASPRQQSFLRSARAGTYPDQAEERRVKYLTEDVNNLLDVRF